MTHASEARGDGIDVFARAVHRLTEVTAAIDAHAIVSEWNPDGTIRSVNDQFCAVLQYSREELIGQHFSLIDSGDLARPTMSDVSDIVKSLQIWRGELCVKVRDARIFWVDATIVPVLDESRELAYFVGLWNNITELKEAEAKAHQLAYYDPATGLVNRRGLIDLALPQAASDSAECSVSRALVVIGLDNFSGINDALGYELGDELLRQVARRLSAAHPAIAAVARTGSHKFCLVLDGLSGDAAAAEAEAQRLVLSIRQALARTDRASDLGATSEFSVGIAICADETAAPHRVLERAETAMHQARQSGVNQTRLFHPEVHAKTVAQLELLADLRQSVRRDELRLFYQPIVDEQARISGYECLVRWQQPNRGLMSPDEFIPLADRTGYIHVIGDWVMERACERIAQWAQCPETEHLTLSVNVSAQQFRDPDFSDRIATIVRETGANPNRLRIELTESVFHVDLETSVRSIQGLCSAGIGFSLDDFGTGYSSLEYLSRLPVQQLKIDRSFVSGIGESSGATAIVQMILGLARTLGLQTVAEGIETEEQFVFMRENGCDSFQGYYFGRPAPLLDA